jgi:putative zinc finger/helix-turn-helix YgiT family protein
MTDTLSKCPNCRKRAVSPRVEPYADQIEHDGRNYAIEVPNASLLVCSVCGNKTLTAETSDKVSDEIRKAAGLLFPSQIRQERFRCRLTQEDLGKLLIVGPATVSRWETGAQIQSHHMDEMLRMFFTLPSAREWLEYRVLARQGAAATPPRQPVATNTTAEIVALPVNSGPYAPVRAGGTQTDGMPAGTRG